MIRLTRGPSVVWGALCALTLTSFGLVELGSWGDVSSAAIVTMCAAKSRLVIVHYMEARRAARHWRVLHEAWNIAAAAIIIGLFLSPAA